MSDKFQNGLLLTAPTASQCGRTFSRWLVEWLTQLCGWTVVQAVAGNWTNVVASGSAGVSVAGQPNRFDIGSGYTFVAANDVGAYLTITGFTGTRVTTRNGIYRIRRVISATVVELEVECSVHEDGFPSGLTGLAWRLWRPAAAYVPTSTDVIVLKGRGTTGAGYDFHLHINVRATNSYFPELRMSPWASWVPGPGWSDLRYTSALGIDNYSNSLLNTDRVRVWAAGDADRAVLMMRVEDDYFAWHFIYLGEIDPKDAVNDPRPCVLWAGSNAGVLGVGDDLSTLIGYGSVGTVLSGGRWLAFDGTTTVTGYALIACVPSSADAAVVANTEQQWNEPTRARHRQPILCECRTSGFMEVRGALRRIWATTRDTPCLAALGVNGEFLHVRGGILMPWCNTKAWYERG